MRRSLFVVGLLVLTLVAGLLPVHAQDGLTPEEQEALDSIRVALESFYAASSYTATTSQVANQVMGVTFMGQTLTLTQDMTGDGTIEAQKAPDSALDNRHSLQNQSITQVLSGMGQNTSSTIDMVVELIIVDDRIYLKLDLPDELAGAAPEDWQDVTDGSDMFPGTDILNLDQIAGFGRDFDAAFLQELFAAVTQVELLGEAIRQVDQSDGTLDSVAVNQFRLTLDPAMALETIGADSLAGMLNADEMPFDVPALINLLYTDEDSSYVVEVELTADGTLALYREIVGTSIDIGPELIVDPSLKGAEMTLQQTITQEFKPAAINEPVEITAPELAG